MNSNLRENPSTAVHRLLSRMSTKPGAPPQEDPREWLLFDIEDQDPIAAEFLKPPPSTFPSVFP